MSLSPRPRSLIESPFLAAAVRFECASKLDGWGSASLELSGELDLAVCEELEARLAEAQRTSPVVTLDLHRLTFMDSAGYAVLVRAARTSKPEAKLILTGCGGQVSRLLNLLGLPEKVEMREGPMASAARTRVSSSTAGLGFEAEVGA